MTPKDMKCAALDCEAIASAVLLVAPEIMVLKFRAGEPYDPQSWECGLDGSNFQPDVFACDWLIRFVRAMGVEPTLSELRNIEKHVRNTRT